MPYIHPAGYPSTPIKQPIAGTSTSPSTPASRVSPHIRPSPTTTRPSASPASASLLLRSSKHRHIHRIPPPAILPPIVDNTNSALHLTLRSEAGSTLSTQVDELLSRHLITSATAATAGGDPGVATNEHVNTGNPGNTEATQLSDKNSSSTTPPCLPPKVPTAPRTAVDSPAGPRQMASPGVAPARRPLPVPPTAQETPYQYPASYGPSISKVRSFPAQFPSSSPYQGLPPGAAHLPSALMPGRQGLGYGRPHAITATGASYAQPWTRNQPQDLPSIPQQQQQSTISRTFAKGGASVFLHKGFFDLLSMAPYATTGPDSPEAEYGQGWMGDRPVLPSAGRAVTSPVYQNRKETLSPPQAKGYRRISVDMIGKPTGFAHLAHASDAEEAAELLTRWRTDGKGKLAEPAWVAAIKDAARLRARNRAIAQVQANLDEEQQKGSLKVVNANPDSLISLFTDRAVHGSHSPTSTLPHEASTPGLPPASPMPTGLQDPTDDVIIVHEDVPYRPFLPPPPPPTIRANTSNTVVIRSADALQALENQSERENEQVSPVGLSSYPIRAPLPAGSAEASTSSNANANAPFKPSLETVEKSVATKIYLENHYYGILKRPRDRDQRRAALERELASANMSDAQRRKIRSTWTLSETEHLRNMRLRVTVNSFHKIKTIGHGAFGVVSLVKEQASGELYAMKQLRKADMLRKGQEGHVRAERDVMSAASSSASSRWIVRLVYSFQDVDHLYLVMEYMGGGDLLNLLIEKDTFEEGFAKFYIAEMVLAIQEAHKLGYIHRDIKPDNFIFSSDGHIKLSDFGLATDLHWSHDGAYYDEQRRQLLRKHGIDLEEGSVINSRRRTNNAYSGVNLVDLPNANEDDEKTANGGLLTIRDKYRKKLAYSVVGTNSYMSPEVIRGTGYDQSCDWWSLGVIMFECLYGFPPFVSKSRHVTRQKILTWRQSLKFPNKPRASRDAQDLISRLICEREERLGSRTTPSTIRPNAVVVRQRRSGFMGPAPGFTGLADGTEDIKAHPWFREIDFATLHLQSPPFKPQLLNPSDTRYFDDDIEDKPLPAPDAQPGQAEATKDPMLRDKVHGKHLLDVRKQLAFQGYTFKSPRQKVFDPRNGLRALADNFEEMEDARGRATQREASSGFRRAMSL